MQIRKLGLYSIIGLLTVFFGLAAVKTANADNSPLLTVTLDSPTITGAPGDTVDFTGILTNVSSDTLTLATDDYTVNPPLTTVANFVDTYDITGPGNDYVLSEFAFGTPDTLAAGAPSSDLDLFSIIIPTTATDGNVFTGTFAVDYLDSSGNYYSGNGGTNAAGTFSPNTINFTVDVLIPPSSTPEPSQLILTMIGMAMLGGLIILRKRATSH